MKVGLPGASDHSVMKKEKVDETAGMTATSASTEMDEAEAYVEEDNEGLSFNFDFLRYQQPKPSVVNNPKLARQQAKAAAMAARASADPQTAEFKLPFSLKQAHQNTLVSILNVSSHSPRWRNALSAIRAIIKEKGGAINGSLGNGSEVEFWIGDVRFLVDSSHGGGDREMMYPAQMKFMKKGLERAGITLSSLQAAPAA